MGSTAIKCVIMEHRRLVRSKTVTKRTETQKRYKHYQFGQLKIDISCFRRLPCWLLCFVYWQPIHHNESIN